MKKLILLFILLLPVVCAIPDNNRPGDHKVRLVNKTINITDEILLPFQFQIFDNNSEVLLDVDLYKTSRINDSIIIEGFDIDENITLSTNTTEKALKWSYNITPVQASLPPGRQKQCEKQDFIEKHRRLCTNNITIYQGGFLIELSSVKNIEKVSTNVFKIDKYFIDWSDLLEEGFTVDERHNSTSIQLYIDKNWEAYNITNNQTIFIDPYVGEQTPSSNNAESSSGGGTHYTGSRDLQSILSEKNTSTHNSTAAPPVEEKDWSLYYFLGLIGVVIFWNDIKSLLKQFGVRL